jgi:hypothetical protein
VKRRTEKGEQGKLDGVLIAGRDEEEQPDSAANDDGILQLGSSRAKLLAHQITSYLGIKGLG